MTTEPSLEALRRDGGWALPDNRWDLLDTMQPQTSPTVSVIVAHYEQPRELARTLLALDRQRYPRELVEIIVVDDGSAEQPVVPGHVTLVSQADDGFRVAAARNLAVSQAHGDVLVFLDADTSPEPDYLGEMVRLPALTWDAVTVGRRRHADLSAVDASAEIAEAGSTHELDEPRWLRDAYRDTGDLLASDHRSYRFIIGAVIACTRRFFDEVGGFDESFSRYGGEDWEWAYRAWARGAVLAHVPTAIAWHDGPDRAVRAPGALDAKNAEVVTLADLIPVPGSRGRALPTAKVDIVVTGPPFPASDGQTFVSRDSVMAELPSGEVAEGEWAHTGRYDRVRIAVHIEQPVRVAPGALAPAIEAIETGRYAEVVLRDDERMPLVRVTSMRARARQVRWGGEPLLPSLDLSSDGVTPLVGEVDVEAYVGGWG